MNKETKLDLITKLIEKYIELDKIRNYCNHELQKISITYSNQVVQIDSKWRITKDKFSSIKQ